MSAYGDGFVPYHVEVNVRAGHLQSVKTTIEGWKARVRDEKTWRGFPETLVESIEHIDGVDEVVLEGAHSSVLIPLRMVAGLTQHSCTFSAVLGTGPIADTLAADCADWGIDLRVSKRVVEGDSPLEFSIREPNGESASVRLYPASRKKFRAGITSPDTTPDKLVLNRTNKGLLTLAQSVFEQDGIISLRIRDFGRYSKPEDYVPMLPLTRQLVLSSRDGVVGKLARYAGIAAPRGWPNQASALLDDNSKALGRWLLAQMPNDALVALIHYQGNATAFFRSGFAPVLVVAPPQASAASRAARLQGAMLGLHHQGQNEIATTREWQTACERLVAIAFEGTEQRPWQYPPFACL